MITQSHIQEIALMLPFGSGRQVARRAKVSDAMVSMLFNGKIKNLETDVVGKIIAQSIQIIKEKSETRRSLVDRLKSLVGEMSNEK